MTMSGSDLPMSGSVGATAVAGCAKRAKEPSSNSRSHGGGDISEVTAEEEAAFPSAPENPARRGEKRKKKKVN